MKTCGLSGLISRISAGHGKTFPPLSSAFTLSWLLALFSLAGICSPGVIWQAGSSEPPICEVEMPGKWFMTAFEEWACREAYHIVIHTDTPCHLWLRWTNLPPWKHPRTRVLRGLNIEGDVYFCFAAYTDVEQDEPGDTLEHTFTVAPVERFMVIYFYFFGEIAVEPSPSNSPIFARYIDYEAGYLNATVTHENDVVASDFTGVWSNPPLAPAFISVGRAAVPGALYGGAFRIRCLTLPRCAEILTCHVIFTAWGNTALVPVHSRISAENVDDADDFYDISAAAFWARWAARTGISNWGNMDAWYNGVQYESPSLVSPVQTVISRPGWTTGNSLVIFWEDFDQTTPFAPAQLRTCRAFAEGLVGSPVLHIWYNHWQVKEVNVF